MATEQAVGTFGRCFFIAPQGYRDRRYAYSTACGSSNTRVHQVEGLVDPEKGSLTA